MSLSLGSNEATALGGAGASAPPAASPEEDEAEAAFGSEFSTEELLAQLQRQMEVLYVHPDPQQKAAANAWLLSFQRSRVAWSVCRLLVQQWGNAQLQLLGAQSLAWKVEQQGASLNAAHKAELSEALFSLVEEMEQVRDAASSASDGVGNASSLDLAVGGRLAHCLASLAFQRLKDGAASGATPASDSASSSDPLYLQPLQEIIAFGRGGLDATKTRREAASSSGPSLQSPPLTFRCWVALGCLSSLPQLLAASDTPARGGRRFAGCTRAKALSEVKSSVLCFAADVLSAASSQAAAGPLSEGGRVLVAPPLSAAERESASAKSLSQSCGEAALVLLSAWFVQQGAVEEGGFQTPLQERNVQRQICEALVRGLSGFFYSVELTEALTALLPRMPSFMALWEISTPASEAVVHAFWSQPTLPGAETGEGLLLSALLTAVGELVKRVREAMPSIERRPRSGATAALVKWGCVLLALLEGYPQLLLAPQGSACGDLLLLLWEASPVTWLRASGFWTQLKELRRDELVPLELLRELSQRVAPACTLSLLRHCRRTNAAWQGEGEDDWTSFVEAGGDVLSDLFCLAQACGEPQAVAFVEGLIRPLAEATAVGDSAGAEAVLLLSDSVVEAFGFIPHCFAGAFVLIPSLPRDCRCAAAAARLLRKTAIHFTEDPEYDGLQCGGAGGPPHCPVGVLGQIWLCAVQAMTQFLPLQPLQVAEALLQLSIWGSHHLGAQPPDEHLRQELLEGASGAAAAQKDGVSAAAASPCGARRRAQLEDFCAFVCRVAPEYPPAVDATLFAAVVKMMLHVERREKVASFVRLLSKTAEQIRLCAAVEDSSDGGAAAACSHKELRTRLLFRVEGCVAALHSGRVYLARTGRDPLETDAEAASDAVALFLFDSQEPQQQTQGGAEAGLAAVQSCTGEGAAALESFGAAADASSMAPLWKALLRLAEPTLLAAATGAFVSTPRRLDFSQVLSLKQRLHGGTQPAAPDLNASAATFACALRCLRLLLAVLGCREDAAAFWAAVVALVENVASAAVQNATPAVAGGVASQGASAGVCVAALEGCSVVLLSDILRIAAASPALQRRVRDRVAGDVAAAATLAVHVSAQLPAELGGCSVPFFDLLATFLSACTEGLGTEAASSAAAQRGGLAEDGVSLFVERVFPAALELSANVLKGDNAEAAKRCLSFLQQCSKRREAGLRLGLEQSLPRLVVAILDSLPTWGAEALAVLWAVVAIWRENFADTLVTCVEAWLGCTYTAADSGGTAGEPRVSPLQKLEASQKQLLVLCLKSFRGPRIRQLLQDMILMASGLVVPGEALLAYEFLLRESGAASPSAADLSSQPPTAF